MVNAQDWLNQNYPNETREQLTELDVSNKNLEGVLTVWDTWGFANIQKLNISFNKITSLDFRGKLLEILDLSNNHFNGGFLISGSSIKKFNFSFNNINNYEIILPSLTHLDCSSNPLINLNLLSSKNLVELKCLNVPTLSNLSLNYSPSLKYFDCLGAKLVGLDSFSPSSTTSTETMTVSTAATSLATNVSEKLNAGEVSGIAIGVAGVLVGIVTLWFTSDRFKTFAKKSLSFLFCCVVFQRLCRNRTAATGSDMNLDILDSVNISPNPAIAVDNASSEQLDYDK